MVLRAIGLAHASEKAKAAETIADLELRRRAQAEERTRAATEVAAGAKRKKGLDSEAKVRSAAVWIQEVRPDFKRDSIAEQISKMGWVRFDRAVFHISKLDLFRRGR